MLHLQLNFKVTLWTKYFYQHVCFVKIKRDMMNNNNLKLKLEVLKFIVFLERILMAGL